MSLKMDFRFFAKIDLTQKKWLTVIVFMEFEN